MASKYKQIYNQLYELISTGKYRAGDTLPTEMEMVQEYGVSRITVQKALKMLVDAGYIERIAGKGTFVKQFYDANKKRKSIALIMPINNPEMTLLLNGVQEVTNQSDYEIKIYFTNKQISSEPEVVENAMKDGVEGIIIYPYTSASDNACFYRRVQRKIPLVFVDKRVDGVVTDTVMSNNFEGAYEMVDFLIRQNGHRRIAYIDWGRPGETSDERKSGYIQALVDNGIAVDEAIIMNASPSEKNVKASLENIINDLFSDPKRSDVTAIFFFTDELALSGSYYINRMQKSIPQDISVCGFDNSYLGRSVIPSLTTVAQDFAEIGASAARLLIERICNDNGTRSVIYVATKIIKRDSVRNIKEK